MNEKQTGEVSTRRRSLVAANHVKLRYNFHTLLDWLYPDSEVYWFVSNVPYTVVASSKAKAEASVTGISYDTVTLAVYNESDTATSLWSVR